MHALHKFGDTLSSRANYFLVLYTAKTFFQVFLLQNFVLLNHLAKLSRVQIGLLKRLMPLMVSIYFRDLGEQSDFEKREHVMRINFQELLQHFKSVQRKHLLNKRARPNQQGRNLFNI